MWYSFAPTCPHLGTPFLPCSPSIALQWDLALLLWAGVLLNALLGAISASFCKTLSGNKLCGCSRAPSFRGTGSFYLCGYQQRQLSVNLTQIPLPLCPCLTCFCVKSLQNKPFCFAVKHCECKNKHQAWSCQTNALGWHQENSNRKWTTEKVDNTRFHFLLVFCHLQ